MSEKWNYKAYITPQQAPEREEELRTEFDKPQSKEVWNVRELPMNKFERTATADALHSLYLELQKMKLPKLTLHRDQIHILSDEELGRIFEPDVGGKTSFGHIYLKRNSDKSHFIHDLTHELSHTAGFYSLNIVASRDEIPDEKNISLRRSGHLFRSPHAAYEESDFQGFDEAGTEMFAREIRNTFVSFSSLLEKREKERLVNTSVYREQTMVVSELLRKMSHNEEDYREYLNLLFRGRILGDYDILKVIEKSHPGAVRILRKMGSEPEDALRAAKELGLEEVAQEIESSHLNK